MKKSKKLTASDDMVYLDVHDVQAVMKYRCGDPMNEADYARLDALMRPGEKCPRREEIPLISDLPKYAWNRKVLAEQLGLTPDELEFVLLRPKCPQRRANGRWPTQEIATFMMQVLEERGYLSLA
jgi:hypothetical protein